MQPRATLARIRELAQRPRGVLHCCVAWSGGLDSTVLLDLLCAARSLAPGELRLRALHVDHGLQRAASGFVRHCRGMARELRVPLQVLRVRVRPGRGESVEEQARLARYRAFAQALRPGELLLTGQHGDDQFESLLLAALRGAGPAGLAGMAPRAVLGPGLLLRPLLGHGRAQIESHARARGLRWIEDPTNPDSRFDRNFLRLRVMPALHERWPGLAATGSRSARHCAQAAAMAGALARRDVETASDGADLEAAVLRRWTAARAGAALRAWLAGLAVRAPDERRIAEMLRMLEAREQAAPSVVWGSSEVCLQQGRLRLRARRQPAAASGQEQWRWREQGTLRLGEARLALRSGRGDVDLAQLPEELCIRWYDEPPALLGRSRRSLHKLFQELGIPAAERAQLPLVCAPGAAGVRLLAIADRWVEPSLRSGAATRRTGRFIWRASR